MRACERFALWVLGLEKFGVLGNITQVIGIKRPFSLLEAHLRSEYLMDGI